MSYSLFGVIVLACFNQVITYSGYPLEMPLNTPVNIHWGSDTPLENTTEHSIAYSGEVNFQRGS